MISLVTRGYLAPPGGDVVVLAPSGIVSITGDPSTRFTPVVARMQVASGAYPWIIYSGGDSQFDERLIFWPTRPEQANQSGDQRWTPQYRDRSSLVVDGDELVATILPNSGWWRDNFNLLFIAGVEMIEGV